MFLVTREARTIEVYCVNAESAQAAVQLVEQNLVEPDFEARLYGEPRVRLALRRPRW